MFNTISRMLRRLYSVEAATASSLPTLTLTDGTQLPPEEALLAEYYRANEDLDNPSLNAMDNRSPSHGSIVAYLLDTGRTPATLQDITQAYLTLHDRLPGEFELETTIDQVRQFGMVEENQHS